MLHDLLSPDAVMPALRASNKKQAIQYLAAGSIQGLRPLRYEKRVARNRFLALLALLILVLWGLAYWSFKR